MATLVVLPTRRPTAPRWRAAALAAATALSLGCQIASEPPRDGAVVGRDADPVTADSSAQPDGRPLLPPGHDTVMPDTSPKEGPRMMPAETYIRSYLRLFGALAPADTERDSSTGLFDRWSSYLLVLGLPEYRLDTERNDQPSALLASVFERLGIALCDRAVRRDLAATTPAAQRLVLAFDVPVAAAPLDAAAFAPRFDALHRTFLGYPAALAPPGRAARFYELYRRVATRPRATGPRAYDARQAAWASVCQAFVRHPEFHLY